MLYLYLDESGDLGFDFVSKKPSKFFTVTILAVKGHDNNRALAYVVKKILKRKINRKKSTRIVQELKGNETSLEVKKYLWGLIKDVDFSLYSMTLNKRRVYEKLTRQKDHVYNFIARQVLDHIPFEAENCSRIDLIVDKSKAKPEIENFNSYIERQLKGRINPKIPLTIQHKNSMENYGLQICDVFCWGVFRSYESRNKEWQNVFNEKIKYNDLYLQQ